MHDVSEEFFKEKSTCDDLREIYEGWNVHTWDKALCHYLFSPMLVSTQTCDYDGQVRYANI